MPRFLIIHTKVLTALLRLCKTGLHINAHLTLLCCVVLSLSGAQEDGRSVVAHLCQQLGMLLYLKCCRKHIDWNKQQKIDLVFS